MDRKKRTIFIIEDNPIDIALILQALGNEYDLRVFTSGETVSRIMEQDPPSLVLLDIMLPGISGFAICEYLKATTSTSKIPVIFLTSQTKTTHETKALALGATDFIRKPIEPGVLKHRVHNQMEILRYLELQQTQASKRILQAECETIQNMAVILLKAIDLQTGKHIENTQRLFTLLAKGFAAMYPGLLDPDTISSMARASVLHDIGKAGIPSQILSKNGPLTSEEIARIRQHPQLGAEIIESLENVVGQSSYTTYSSEMALFHHEKWDGSGYPFGLKGEEIPLSARLMALVDVYEALVSTRSYRAALPHEDAFRIIIKGDNRILPGHFDPKVLEAFRRIEQEFAFLGREENLFLITNRVMRDGRDAACLGLTFQNLLQNESTHGITLAKR